MDRDNTFRKPLGSASVPRVLISGANGLIGRELSMVLRSEGIAVSELSRRRDRIDTVYWDPLADEIDPNTVSGFDAVIHLAGEPVGTRRWTEEKKRKIYDSRVHGTAVLAQALAKAAVPPKVFLCASGVNYYPSNQAESFDENASAGHSFLSKVCVDWERASLPLIPISRVVWLRIGVVLSKKGGMLAKMLPAFRWGLGGYVGRGELFLSWITLDDLARAVLHILLSEGLCGPVNLVSPEPVSGKAFANALALALGRPAIFRVPAAIVRFVLGDMADETILSDIRAVPSRLISDGFAFGDNSIQRAIESCLNKKI